MLSELFDISIITSPRLTEAPSSATMRSTMPDSSGESCTVVMGCTVPVRRT